MQTVYSVVSPDLGHCSRIATLAGQLGYPCTGAEIRMRLAEMAGSGEHVVYVAQLPGGQIVGWVGAYILRTVELNCRVEVSGLVVDEEIRSRGIGKALLNAVEAWARTQGCTTISVRSNIIRHRAHRFYLKNGYAHVKSQKEFRKRL